MSFETLSGLPVDAGAALFIGIFVALSLCGAFIVHRLVPQGILAEHNEIAGFIFAVVGVIYAVLLAFFAIGVYDRFGTAEQRTFDEANRLVVVYRKADLFGQVHLIRAELIRYTQLVIDPEWDLMQQGHESPQAAALSEKIAFQVRHLRVSNMAQQNVHATMVQSMDEALADRDDRTSLSRIGISGFLWGILIAGAVCVVCFAYLFAFRNTWSIVTIVGLLAFMLGLVLYLIAAVDYPFQGEIRVGPDAFVTALATYKTIGP